MGTYIILLLIACLLVLMLLWIWAIKPVKQNGQRSDQMKAIQEVYIAHRGLFSNQKRILAEGEDMAPLAPENSLAAFRLAVEAGYGIELDVQLTKDGKLVVFHDKTLKRMCGIKKQLFHCTYEELQKYKLLESEEKIPLFQEVLEVVAGRIPMIIEIKPEGDCSKTAESLANHMKDYEGNYCVESFSPKAIAWYRKHKPEVIRGQLSEIFPKKKKAGEKIIDFLLTNLLFNFYAKPDFIAYHHKHKNQMSYRLLRKLYPVYNVAWTIRSQEELEEARDVFSIFIFDSFIPS